MVHHSSCVVMQQVYHIRPQHCKNSALFVNILSSVAAVSSEVAIGRAMTTRLAKIAHAVKLRDSILVRSVSSKGRNNTISSYLNCF